MEIRRATKGPRPGLASTRVENYSVSVKALQLLNFTAGVTTRLTRHWNSILLQVTRLALSGQGLGQCKLNFYL
jgi:hypothetical protein